MCAAQYRVSPDRAYLGIQNLDDSLVWIEISLTAPSPAGTDPPPAVSGAVTFQRNLYDYGTTGAADRLLGLAKRPGVNQVWACEPVFHRVGGINISTGARDVTATVSQWCAGVYINATSGHIYVADGHESGSTQSVIRRFVGSLLAEPAWGGSTFGTGALNGVAVSDDSANIYVCDDGGNLLRRIRLSDKVQINSLALTQPYGVDVDASSNVYVSDASANTVQRRNATLATQAWVVSTAGAGDGQLNTPGGVVLDDSGRLWVVDIGNDRVQAFRASDGTYLGKFGTSGTGNGQFTQASGIAYSGNLLWVSDAMTSGFNARISEWIVADDFPV
jgi:sugar lactone lactonase YvrE